MKKRYVVGFAFDADSVALVEKQRPAWQKGRLNGIGGHIEDGELPHAAMVREFAEETGQQIPLWHHFCSLHGHDAEGQEWTVFFYSARVPLLTARTITDEHIFTCNRDGLKWFPCLPNLAWLIPMALSVEGEQESATCFEISEVDYKDGRTQEAL